MDSTHYGNGSNATLGPCLVPRHIETSVQSEHEARADLLRQLGDHRAAERVLRCGTAPLFWVCKRRDCPSCCERITKANADRITAAVRQMDRPVVGIFTLSSLGPRDLALSLSEFREALRRVRRRRCMSGVSSAAGAVECHWSDTGQRWLVHAHVVLDTVEAFDPDVVAREWREMTRSRGTFALHPRYRSLVSARGFARYASKTADLEPADPALFARVRRATKGRRLLVSWGLGLEPKETKR